MGDADDRVVTDAVAVHVQGDDLARMEFGLGSLPDVAHHNDDARDFEACRCRSGTAAGDHEQEQDAFGEGWPAVVVGRDEARRRDGRRLERRIAQGRSSRYVKAIHEIDTDEGGRHSDDQQIGLKFRIAPEDVRAFLPGLVIEAVVAAGEDHEKGHPGFDGRALEVGRTGVIRGKVAGRNRRQGVVQSPEEVHAAEEEDDEGRRRKGHVHAKQDLGHVMEPGQDPFPRRPCRFGIVHVDRRLARFRQQGDKDDDDTQSAEPVGQTAPEKEALRQNLQIGDDRRPGPGKAGNALEQAVEIVR